MILSLSLLIGDVMSERSRVRNVQLMLVAINKAGKPEVAGVIFAEQISTIGVTTGEENVVAVSLSNRFE
ncbi:MAG: hypothetical protein ACL7BU_05730 [Candidatus Phlomobacter fragariae]